MGHDSDCAPPTGLVWHQDEELPQAQREAGEKDPADGRGDPAGEAGEGYQGVLADDRGGAGEEAGWVGATGGKEGG